MPTDTETFSVEFTRTEADELVKLIDLAVKSVGLQVAHNAVVFHQKIDRAYRSRKAAVSAPVETAVPTSTTEPASIV